LNNFYDSIKCKIKTNAEKERAMEVPLETFSKKIWPWSESKLIFLVALLIILDFISTYAFLNFGKNPQVVEGGLLAGWALQTGGFLKLLLVDAIAVGGLILVSISTRSLFSRLGFPGLGRSFLVFLLAPYFLVTLVVVYNNIFWALF
jgi:hypothetical protein